ncbi:hypothetical protein BpHYR1_021437 [Brachionus plicatilis]|uniref:Uncharacterized protein n=1 Tax=Brachionus plicatilis TaxID=10195 RepID=A0A3M7Q7R1_BRAPC|nr:hypothetical protein BpHYR1_021437 [Brachionus plicatilis]
MSIYLNCHFKYRLYFENWKLSALFLKQKILSKFLNNPISNAIQKTSNLTEFEDEFIKISDINKLAVTNRELNEFFSSFHPSFSANCKQILSQSPSRNTSLCVFEFKSTCPANPAKGCTANEVPIMISNLHLLKSLKFEIKAFLASQASACSLILFTLYARELELSFCLLNLLILLNNQYFEPNDSLLKSGIFAFVEIPAPVITITSFVSAKKLTIPSMSTEFSFCCDFPLNTDDTFFWTRYFKIRIYSMFRRMRAATIHYSEVKLLRKFTNFYVKNASKNKLPNFTTPFELHQLTLFNSSDLLDCILHDFCTSLADFETALSHSALKTRMGRI